MTSLAITEAAPLSHREAMALQADELDRTLGLLRGLDEAQWAAPTDCPGWDVRTMYLHVLGACEAAASLRENVHQLLVARKRHKASAGVPLEAVLSALQIEERATLTPPQLLERLTAIAPVAVRKRTSLPGVLRSQVRIPVDGPVVETWRLGYLVDTIYLRDLWMHRVDACRAIGAPPVLDAAHDGRIVADVVTEWARRHGRPFKLTLTGPAGGTFTAGEAGTAGEAIELDAVEFARTLSGRVPARGLLATTVPF